MVGDIKNTITIPFFGVVYITAVIIAAAQHFSGLDFGLLGTIAWVIVIVGAVAFVIYIIGLFMDWW